MKIQKIIDSITPQDALAILKKLAREDADIEERIQKVAMEYLSEVSIDEVAEQVYSELDFIDIQDVWNHSGKTEYGYNDPNDVVVEIFEERLEPFIEEMQKYAHLSLFKEARYYCMGVLKGIYRFDKESKLNYLTLYPKRCIFSCI